MFPVAVLYMAVSGDETPPKYPMFGVFGVIFFALLMRLSSRYPMADEQADSAARVQAPDDSYEAQLAAVGGDETLLPEEPALDVRTPQLWVTTRWSLLPALIVAVAVVATGGSVGVAAVAFVEVVVAVWLAVVGFGPITGHLELNGFMVAGSYESRSSAATFRAFAFWLLPVIAALALHCAVLLDLVSFDLAVDIGAVVLGGSVVLVVTLSVFGRPRFLLPQLVRRHGPHTLWARVPPPPYGPTARPPEETAAGRR